MVMKTCVICGREFEPHYNTVSRQICCSKECLKVRTKQMTNKEARRERAKMSYRKAHKDTTVCKICGMPTAFGVRPQGRRRYHESCVLEQAMSKIKWNESFTSAERQRLVSFGYSVKELRKEWTHEP